VAALAASTSAPALINLDGNMTVSAIRATTPSEVFPFAGNCIPFIPYLLALVFAEASQQHRSKLFNCQTTIGAMTLTAARAQRVPSSVASIGVRPIASVLGCWRHSSFQWPGMTFWLYAKAGRQRGAVTVCASWRYNAKRFRPAAASLVRWATVPVVVVDSPS
jgi:hypothetical protein